MTGETPALLPLTSRAAPIALVCVPNGGGTAAIYAEWAAALEGTARLYAAEFSGRGTRASEGPAATLSARVTELADAIAARVEGPVALFGHSLGAMTAAFVADRLQEVHGRASAMLLVACAPSPILTPDERARLAWLAAMPDAQFASFAAFVAGKPLPIAQAAPAFVGWARGLRHDTELASQYDFRPRSLACPVVGFVAARDPMAAEADVARWSECTSSSFHLERIAGDHHSVIGAGRSELLARLVARLRGPRDANVRQDGEGVTT